jgi:hypothetical protein
LSLTVHMLYWLCNLHSAAGWIKTKFEEKKCSADKSRLKKKYQMKKKISKKTKLTCVNILNSWPESFN